jgi:IS30 family transposase
MMGKLKTAGQSNQRKARKINRKKVLDLHAKGLSTEEIARHQGVAPSTVWRFLQQTEPERQALETFKANRADVLARLQAKSLDAQERILDTIDDGMVAALTPSQKSGLLMSLNAQSGTVFDKERLERGQSTANVSLIGKMMTTALEAAHTPLKKNDTAPSCGQVGASEV